MTMAPSILSTSSIFLPTKLQFFPKSWQAIHHLKPPSTFSWQLVLCQLQVNHMKHHCPWPQIILPVCFSFLRHRHTFSPSFGIVSVLWSCLSHQVYSPLCHISHHAEKWSPARKCLYFSKTLLKPTLSFHIGLNNSNINRCYLRCAAVQSEH